MLSGKGGKLKNSVLTKTSRRHPYEYTTEYSSYMQVRPEGLGDINEKSHVDFYINSGQSIYRFLENPICIKYRLLEFKKAVATAAEKTWVVSTNDTFFGYVPELLGVASFISGYEVYLDNVKIGSESSRFAPTYQAASKRLCSEKVRKELNVHHVPQIQEDLDKENPMLKAMTKDLNCALGSKVITGGWLGAPFLGYPRNLTLDQIMHQRGSINVPDLLTPHTSFHAVLFLNPNKLLRFGRAGMKVDSHFQSKKLATDDWNTQQMNPETWKIEIMDMWLQVEKLSFGEKTVIQNQVLKKDPLRFWFDKPIFSVQEINEGLQHTANNHIIPPNTKCAYLTFPQGFTMWGDKVGTRSSDSSNFPLPRNLVKFTVKVNDTVVQWPEGFRVDWKKQYGCPDNMQYHTFLRERNLVNCTYEQFALTSGGTLNNVFLLDFSTMDLSKPGILNISLEYDTANFSTGGFQTCLTFVSESSYKRLAGGTWEAVP